MIRWLTTPLRWLVGMALGALINWADCEQIDPEMTVRRK